MAAVLGPKLAKKFNWYGKKGKSSFKSLQLSSAVFGEFFQSSRKLPITYTYFGAAVNVSRNVPGYFRRPKFLILFNNELASAIFIITIFR